MYSVGDIMVVKIEYPLKQVESDTIIEIRGEAMDSSYSQNIRRQMHRDNNVPLEIGMKLLLKDYARTIDSRLPEHVGCLTYNLLTSQLEREDLSVPEVSQTTIGKFIQQINNERLPDHYAFKRLMDENPLLAAELAEVIDDGTKDSDKVHNCIGMALYIHDNLRAQARIEQGLDSLVNNL